MQHFMKYCSRIAAVIVATLCLSGIHMPVAFAESAEQPFEREKKVKLDERLGVEPGKVLAELKAHEKDGYYLGTPYDSSPLTEENCMRPNGAYGGNGGMNCTGFVAYVLEKCGADLSGIAGRGYRGGKVNASNWYHWMQENAVEYYHYNTIEELLASGNAQKGDVIYFEPVSWDSADADCHIGFFWGDGPADNKFWHSATKPSRGNQISEIVSKSPSTVYLFKITHMGNLQIQKKSANPVMNEKNSLYTLAGAEYTVYQSGTSKVVAVITTDENGIGKAENLPEGIYDIQETKAPGGYALENGSRQVRITSGETVYYECEDVPESTPVGLLVRKMDTETEGGDAQGSLSFAGTQFKVEFYDAFFTNAEETIDRLPLRSWVFAADENGEVWMDQEHLLSGDELFEGNVLPLGTVTIQETEAPEGYLLDKKIYCQKTGEEAEGNRKSLEILNDTEVGEQIIRGDLKLRKVAEETQENLVDIPFQITSVQTGEWHVIKTDANGEASTEEIWFGEGEKAEGKGAMPYGKYLIEELLCEKNKDRILIPAFEVEVTQDQCIIDLGTLVNEAKPVPEIHTLALDKETGTHEGKRADQTVLEDQIYWKNLEPGETYVMKGVLMNKTTGEALVQDEKEIAVEEEFTPNEAEGEMRLEFTFSSKDLKGEEVVVFEYLYQQDEVIAEHADLENAEQTVRYPQEPKKEEVPESPQETEKPEKVATGDAGYAEAALLILMLLTTSAVLMRYILMKMWKRG